MIMKGHLFICASILILFISTPIKARIIHVPADSSTIQAGINGAVDGDTVLVARGHYYERINFVGKAVLVTSNWIFDNDSITIDSTIIDAENSGSAVTFSTSEDSSSIIQGFTITNGNASSGGGVYCFFASPTISNNIVTTNIATDGGGIYSHPASPTISNNTITSNSATNGGGIYCVELSPTINHNTISMNIATHWGGGIYCFYMFSPTISNNTISGNSAGAEGGGLYCDMFAFASAINSNVITGNFAGSYGGGIFCTHLSSSTIIANNTVNGNSAGLSGGGIACALSEPIISNNIINGNIVSEYGGGIFCFVIYAPAITNNIICYNSAGSRGGGVCCASSSPSIINNIISNNLDGEGIASLYDSYPVVCYNNVWNNIDGNFYGCPTGMGDTIWGVNFNDTHCDSFYNIIRDPLFADSINFELLCNSPCIDAGDPDIYVRPDSGGCRIDMGAHEYPYILGDANSDSIITPKESRIGAVNIGDIVFLINYLFQSGLAPCPYHAGDTNCDGEINLADIVCLINYLFRGGVLPCESGVTINTSVSDM